VGTTVAAVKPWMAMGQWPWSEHGRHGRAVVRTVWLTSGAHMVLYFSQIIQTGSNMEIENGCLTMLQKLLFKHFLQAPGIPSELLFKQCSCYSDTRVSHPSPLREISSRDLEGVAALTETVNNCATPHYGKTKSGWKE
jgi:hypothetical protein